MTYRVAGLLCLLAASAGAQNATALLREAAAAAGWSDLRSLEFTAMGSSAEVGQNHSIHSAWPASRVKSYVRGIDFVQLVSRIGIVTPGGSAAILTSARSPWGTQYEYWMNPAAFVKAALSRQVTSKRVTEGGAAYNEITFPADGGLTVSGLIDDRNRVEYVRTKIANEVLGDMKVDAWFSDYRDFNGLKFPATIVEKQGGFPVLILAVSDVKPNAAVIVEATAAPPAADAGVLSKKVADGVYYLAGGAHHSVLVEFADYSAIIEAPENEQRTAAVMAEAKRLAPAKPVRYVISTHHHFDHIGGLRAFAAAGVTIVVPEADAEFYKRVLSAERTIQPDRLSELQTVPNLETAGARKVLSDGNRVLELHRIESSPHADPILLAYLPKEKILIEADVLARDAANLVANVERLRLDFDGILPLDGSEPADRAALYKEADMPMREISAIIKAAKPAAAARDGRQVLEGTCAGCHSLDRIQGLKLSKGEWQGVVDRMKSRGADLDQGDTGVLVDYLAKSYGK
jgi:hypothetical protein